MDTTWICTCYACPEQYDIKFRYDLVAYFRLRWGHIQVWNYDEDGNIGNDLIFEESYGNGYTGSFDSEEDKASYQKKIEDAICVYYSHKNRLTISETIQEPL